MRRLAAWLALGALAVLLVEISCVSPKDEAKQRDVTRTPRQISQRYTSQSTDPYYTAIRSKYCYQQTPYRRNHPTYAGFTKINSGCEKENIQVTPCLCPCTRERINFKNGEYIVVNTDAFTNDDETNNNPNQCASQGETITNLNTNARTKEVSSERSSLENSGNPLGSVESTTGIESITEGYKPQSSVSGLSSPNTFVTSATGGNENNKNGGITTGAEYSLPNQPGVNHQTGALPGNIGSTTGFDSNGYNTQSSVGGSSSSNAQYTSSTGGGVPNLSGGMTTGAEYSLTNQQGVDYQTGAVPGKIGSTTGINSNVEGYNPQSSVGGPSSSNAYYTSSTGGGVPNINGGMTTGAEYSLTNQQGLDYQTGAVPGKIGSTTGINSNVEGYNPQSSVGGPSSSNAYYTSSTGGGVPNINGGMTTGAEYSLTNQPGVDYQTGAVPGKIGSTNRINSNVEGYNPQSSVGGSSSSNAYYTSTTGGGVPNINGGMTTGAEYSLTNQPGVDYQTGAVPGKIGSTNRINSNVEGYNPQSSVGGSSSSNAYYTSTTGGGVPNINGGMTTGAEYSLTNQPGVNQETGAVPGKIGSTNGINPNVEGYYPQSSVGGPSSSNAYYTSSTGGGVTNINGGMTTGAEYSLTNQPGVDYQTGAVPGKIGSTTGFDSNGYNTQSSVGGSSSSNAQYTSSTGGGVPNLSGGMTTGAEYSLTNQQGVDYQTGAVPGKIGSTTGINSNVEGYNPQSSVGGPSSSNAYYTSSTGGGVPNINGGMTTGAEYSLTNQQGLDYQTGAVPGKIGSTTGINSNVEGYNPQSSVGGPSSSNAYYTSSTGGGVPNINGGMTTGAEYSLTNQPGVDYQTGAVPGKIGSTNRINSNVEGYNPQSSVGGSSSSNAYYTSTTGGGVPNINGRMTTGAEYSLTNQPGVNQETGAVPGKIGSTNGINPNVEGYYPQSSVGGPSSSNAYYTSSTGGGVTNINGGMTTGAEYSLTNQPGVDYQTGAVPGKIGSTNGINSNVEGYNPQSSVGGSSSSNAYYTSTTGGGVPNINGGMTTGAEYSLTNQPGVNQETGAVPGKIGSTNGINPNVEGYYPQSSVGGPSSSNAYYTSSTGGGVTNINGGMTTGAEYSLTNQPGVDYQTGAVPGKIGSTNGINPNVEGYNPQSSVGGPSSSNAYYTLSTGGGVTNMNGGMTTGAEYSLTNQPGVDYQTGAVPGKIGSTNGINSNVEGYNPQSSVGGSSSSNAYYTSTTGGGVPNINGGMTTGAEYSLTNQPGVNQETGALPGKIGSTTGFNSNVEGYNPQSSVGGSSSSNAYYTSTTGGGVPNLNGGMTTGAEYSLTNQQGVDYQTGALPGKIGSTTGIDSNVEGYNPQSSVGGSSLSNTYYTSSTGGGVPNINGGMTTGAEYSLTNQPGVAYQTGAKPGKIGSTNGINSNVEGYNPQSSVGGSSSSNVYYTSSTGGGVPNINGGMTTGAEYSLTNQPGVDYQTGAVPGKIGSTNGINSNVEGYNPQSSVGGPSSSNAYYTSSTGGGVPNLNGGMTTGAEYSLTNQPGVNQETGAVPGKIGSTTGIDSNIEGYNPQSSVGGPSSSNAYYTSSTGGGVTNINGGMTTGAEYSLTNQPGVNQETGAVPGKIGSTTGIDSNIECYNPQSSVGGPSSSNAYYTSSTGGGVTNINGGMTTGAEYSLTNQPGVDYQTGAVPGKIGSTTGINSNVEGYNPQSSVRGPSSSNAYYTSSTGGGVPNINGGMTTGAEYSLTNQPGVDYQTGAVPGKIGSTTGINSNVEGYNPQSSVGGPSSSNAYYTSSTGGGVPNINGGMTTGTGYSLTNQPGVNHQTGAVTGNIGSTSGFDSNVEGYNPQSSVGGPSSSNAYYTSSTGGGVPNINGGMTTGAEYSLTNQPGVDYQTGAVPGKIGSTTGINSNVEGYNPQSSVGGPSSSNAYYTSSTGGGVPNINGGMTTGAGYSLTNQPGVNHQTGAVTGNIGSTSGFGSNGYNPLSSSSNGYYTSTTGGEVPNKNGGFPGKVGDATLIGSGLSGYNSQILTANGKKQGSGPSSLDHKLQNVNVKNSGYKYEGIFNDDTKPKTLQPTHVSNIYGYKYERHLPMFTNNDFYPSNSLNNQPEVNSQTEAVPGTLRGEKGSHFTIEGYTPKTSVEGSSSSNTLVLSTTRGGVSNTNGGMTTGAEYSLTNQPGENHQTGAVPGDIGSTSGFDSKGYNPQSSVGGSSSSNAYYTSSTGGGVPNKNGGMTTGAEYSLTNQPGVNYQSGAVLGYMGSTTGFDSTSLGYNTENKQTYDSGVGASSSSSAQLAGKGQLLLKNRSPSQQINQRLGYPDYSKTFQKKINSRGVTSKYHSTGYNYEVNPKDQSTNGNVLNTPVSNRYGYNFETNSPIPTGTSQEYWTTLSDQQCIDYPFGGLTSKGVTANPNVKGNMAEGLPKSNQPTGDQSNYEQSFAPTPGASDSPTTTQGTMLLDKSYSKNGIEMKTHDASVPKTESTETLSRGSNGELSTSERELTSGETAGPGKSQNGPSYEAKESTSQRKTTDLTNEDENEKIVSINGYSMKKSQLQYIIDSFKTPEKCILTLPQVFSGPLDRYAHVMKSYPSSVNANQGFIHIQESDLIVPYNCYKSIAETYAPDCPLFADAPGIMLPSGHYVEPSTLGNILASVKTPQEVMVVTPTGHAVPNTVYTKYIQGISSQDKKQLKVMIPNEKNTIPFEVYEEVLNKFTSEPSVDDKHDKGTIRLLGSNVEMPLDQFLEILNSYCNIKQATVTLPSQQSLQLVSFLQIAKILGEDYTKQCIVNIPNTDIKVSFTILAEIYKTYLENKPLDLSKDTDVNFNTPRAENQFDFADEQEEEENPEFETSGRKCYPTYRQSRRNRNGNRRQYYNPRSKYYQRAGSEFVRYPTLCSYPTDYPVPTPFEDPDGLCDSRCTLRTYRTQRLQSSY